MESGKTSEGEVHEILDIRGLLYSFTRDSFIAAPDLASKLNVSSKLSKTSSPYQFVI